MKAIVYTEYGPPDVLHVSEVAKPVPKPDELLIRVRAASVNFGDMLARNFKNVPLRDFTMPLPLYLPSRLSFGYSKPRIPILGSEFAGDVEEVGAQVTRFKPGDAVYGYPGLSMGAYAEYLTIGERRAVAIKPAGISYEQAAAIPYGAIMASALLRHGNIKPGHKVLVNGASGSIGSAAVQLASHYGAEVTGVCGTPRMDYVKSLGAARVIDYTKEDFAQSGETYDLIFDILGKSSFARCKPVLNPGGRYQLVSFKMKSLAQMLWTSLVGDKKVICVLASERREDLDVVRGLVETGKFKAFVHRCFPMEQAAEAHRYAESGLKQGPVVITMAPA